MSNRSESFEYDEKKPGEDETLWNNEITFIASFFLIWMSEAINQAKTFLFHMMIWPMIGVFFLRFFHLNTPNNHREWCDLCVCPSHPLIKYENKTKIILFQRTYLFTMLK